MSQPSLPSHFFSCFLRPSEVTQTAVMAASSATNATGNTALAFPVAALASTGRTLRSFVDPGPVRRSTLGNRPHRHHRPLGGWETMGNPWMVDGERLCCSWLRIYIYRSVRIAMISMILKMMTVMILMIIIDYHWDSEVYEIWELKKRRA